LLKTILYLSIFGQDEERLRDIASSQNDLEQQILEKNKEIEDLKVSCTFL
jgi:hypothetical protein